MSAVNGCRCAALVLAGSLLCACAGSGAAPQGSAAVASASPAATAPLSRTSVPAAPKGSAAPATGSRPQADVVVVAKCYTNATTTGSGQLLIKARSSDGTARLFAYRPGGGLIGEVQNSGSNRYQGTVFANEPNNPVRVTIRSSAGGEVTVPTTPFVVDN